MNGLTWISGEEAPKDGLVVLVEALSDISIEELITWTESLKTKKVNVLPVLEIKDLKDFYIMLGTLDPRAIILANPNVAKQLYFSESLQGYYYNIRIDYYNGVERQILVLPNPSQADWELVKLALIRLEEIL